MLIPSRRHTPADLELWAELEEGDIAHGRRPELAAKAAAGVSEIREFAAAGPCYVSVSWGRDSVAVAHLAAVAGVPDVGLVHLHVLPAPNPETPAVRDAYLATWPSRYREITHTSLYGRPDHEREGAKGRFGDLFVAAGCPPRYVCGVRGSESGARRMRGRIHGISTGRSCAPIQFWSSADVFAYLAVCGLPVHPNYAMSGGGRWPRDRIRVSELGGIHGNAYGRREWETEYYGDVLRRLEAGR